MTPNTKVAIISLGNIGKTLAQNFVKNGRPIIIASRKQEDAKALAQQLGSLATPTDTASAIKEADVVILSVWFNTIQELFQQYAEDLNGKIIIDPSNPIAPDENGGFKKIIGEKESAGLLNAEARPSGATLVKAFGTLGAATLATTANQAPEKAVLFYASDDSGKEGEIQQLITDNGFEPIKVGGLDQSIRIEVFGDLHEFGALGKAVTKDEAQSKI